MPITKAIVPCGGFSTRFLPTVKTYAKQLVPILNRPQIHWVLEELVGAGITDILIIHRENEESLVKHFSPDIELNKYLESTGKQSAMAGLDNILSHAHLTFRPQTKAHPYGNGVPLLIGKDFVGSDPFLYMWGDDLTIEDNPGAFLKSAMALFNQYQPAMVECVQAVPWEEVHKYGTVKYIDDPKYPNRINGLVEKVPRDQAPSNIIQAGRFVCTQKVIEALEKTSVRAGELWLADAVNWLSQNDVVITHNYQENNALWHTTGDPLNWFKANLLLAKTHPDFSSALAP
ncbi:MAG: sugar phosphate nucleotidyltransferase [Candidatus Shapirobacteria bacterium]